MSVVTYSYARQHLAELIDEVERDQAPIYIAHQRRRGAAVLMSLEYFQAMETTMYLLSNPENAARLRKGVVELNAGKSIEYKPIQPKKARRR